MCVVYYSCTYLLLRLSRTASSYEFINTKIITENMINYANVKKYCSEDISLIENFAKAAADVNETWYIHHRREISENKSRRLLIEEGLYYNRPAAELIFLTKLEHFRLHGQNVTDEARKNISLNTLGKKHGPLSEEHKAKISEATKGENNPMFGKNHSEESRRKISETRKARIASGEIVIDTSKCYTPESRAKISAKAKERLSNPENHPMYGKTQSEETRRKISEAKKGKPAWNKGLHNKIYITNGEITKELDKNLPIPDGWTRGRKKKQA